jgi:hypothetical protein
VAGRKEFHEWVRSTTSNSNAAVDTDEKRLPIEGSMEIRGRCIRRNTTKETQKQI